MSKILHFPNKEKSAPQKQEVSFETRVARIHSKLERIDKLLAELKQLAEIDSK